MTGGTTSHGRPVSQSLAGHDIVRRCLLASVLSTSATPITARTAVVTKNEPLSANSVLRPDDEVLTDSHAIWPRCSQPSTSSGLDTITPAATAASQPATRRLAAGSRKSRLHTTAT